MSSDWTRQAQLNELLPTFLRTPGASNRDIDALLGSRWVALGDLRLGREVLPSRGEMREVPSVLGLSRAGHNWDCEVLPGGSTLRLVDTLSEMWGAGYLTYPWFDYVVEDGPLAGRTVTINPYSGMVLPPRPDKRRALAVALIVPVGDTASRDPGAARARYEQLVEILGMPARASDLKALGVEPAP